MFYYGLNGLLYHDIPQYMRIKGVTEEDLKNDIEPLYFNPQKFWRGVRHIGNYTFVGFSDYIEKMDLPKDIVRIGWYAFSGLVKLKEIVLPENVAFVGEGAFEDCSSLTKVKLPKGLKVVSKNMFKNCTSLSEINLENVQVIEAGAFEDCKNLRRINLRSLTSVKKSAFKGCCALKEVYASENMSEKLKGQFKNCNVFVENLCGEERSDINNKLLGIRVKPYKAMKKGANEIQQVLGKEDF